jgi:hypothetical protein
VANVQDRRHFGRSQPDWGRFAEIYAGFDPLSLGC